MLIEWYDALSIGIEEIDNQHKDLVFMLNNLFDAFKKKTSAEETERMIKFLGDYVVTHFGTEEKLMLRYNYPGYSAHKSEHTKFIEEFMSLKNKIETRGVTPSLSLLVESSLAVWLLLHISKVDKVMGEFLKPKMAMSQE